VSEKEKTKKSGPQIPSTPPRSFFRFTRTMTDKVEQLVRPFPDSVSTFIRNGWSRRIHTRSGISEALMSRVCVGYAAIIVVCRGWRI